MCYSKSRLSSSSLDMDQNVARINGRPVLQPTCNRVPSLLERRNSLKKTTQKAPNSLPLPIPSPNASRTTKLSPSPPLSPRPKSPKVANNPVNKLKPVGVDGAKSTAKLGSPSASIRRVPSNDSSSQTKRSSSINIVEAPGSIAAARREQIASMQAMRKMRIAHYGRKVVPIESPSVSASVSCTEKKRCDFITSSSDPVYVAYHDEEWGVPVHEDKILFELLVLTAAQVGSDWTSVLKKRQLFRDAFSGFDAEIVAKFSERKVASIFSEHGVELSQVRGAMDNANQILKIRDQFGSFNNYLWRFVNYKPISTHYKSSQKIPVKTSKSEAISKDMVKRGFRFVGPAVIHSFMQAAGFTNDHLVTCPRHSQCSTLAH